jgi:hypothetical protein
LGGKTSRDRRIGDAEDVLELLSLLQGHQLQASITFAGL